MGALAAAATGRASSEAGSVGVYRLAAQVVEADAGPAEPVAQAVVRLARTGGGW